MLTFDSLISTRTALLPCTAQGRASWAAMVASNIKSLNLKFSVRSKVHPNLIWSAALKSLSAWSHFLPDDELKLYMKFLGCHLKFAICMALTSCFPMLNLFNHSGMLCDASPTGRSTTHADVNELWMPLAPPLNPWLALAIR